MGVTHIIGAGVSGLACAIRLVEQGCEVALYDSAGHAGGRCRSFFDDSLGREIDNGNHLLLSGNRAVMAYLDAIGARDRLISPPSAAFPFVDLAAGRRWTLRPGRGPLPLWLFDESRRVPDSRPHEYLAALRLATAGDKTVAQCFDVSRPIYRRFWEPLAVAVLNTAAAEAAARLLWPVVVETFGRGEAASRPCTARQGLTHTFVEPALAYLVRHQAPARLGQRLRAVKLAGDRAVRLDFGVAQVDLGQGDSVVLALPPAGAEALLPGLAVPQDYRPIVNAHFRLDTAPATEAARFFLGIVGGEAHWLFLREDVVSVTVSAADGLVDLPSPTIASRLWADVARALHRPSAPVPPYQIIKERRATIAQTPEQLALRPPTRGRWTNLFLAGDWTDTGLPATIEGSMRSGRAAAAEVLAPASGDGESGP